MKIIQISDTHLFADPEALHKGFNVYESLCSVLVDIRCRHADLDLLLVTGDLVHDESAEGYQMLADMLGQLQVPVHALTGNHDDAETALRVLAKAGISTNAWFQLDGWSFVMLNSGVTGQVTGVLQRNQLTELQRHLETTSALPTIICLHHPPLPVGCDWLNRIGLTNREEFWASLEGFNQIRMLLFGHAHQQLELFRKNLPVFGTPSTNLQFRRHSTDFSLSDEHPGYRYIRTDEKNILETGVERVDPKCPVV